jgi:hypothetical protein
MVKTTYNISSVELLTDIHRHRIKCKSGLKKMDVPALSYIYAAYGKSGLISNGKE